MQFFVDFEREYLFVLSTKDYGQDEKKFYCLCFNDNHDNEDKRTNLLIKFLVKRRDGVGCVSATIDQLGECKFLGAPTIRNLVNHYLDHHTAKLYEFLRHAAFKSSDLKMKSIASKILLNWHGKEKENSENASESDDEEFQTLKKQADMTSFPVSNCSTAHYRSE